MASGSAFWLRLILETNNAGHWVLGFMIYLMESFDEQKSVI